MSIELKMLLYSSLLGCFHIFIQSTAGTIIRGAKWNMGPRDVAIPLPQGRAARLERALNNFKETFPLFVAAVFLVQATMTANTTTALGAQMYFYGRLVYLPLYFFGVNYVRTVVWMVATAGILLLLLAPLL